MGWSLSTHLSFNSLCLLPTPQLVSSLTAVISEVPRGEPKLSCGPAETISILTKMLFLCVLVLAQKKKRTLMEVGFTIPNGLFRRYFESVKRDLIKLLKESLLLSAKP